jgi:hypothetical protein
MRYRGIGQLAYHRRILTFPSPASPKAGQDRGGAQALKLTVTFLRWVKLSSIPSSENSRPIPLSL